MVASDLHSRSPLETAREMAPVIAAYAERTEESRELPRELFEALFDAGLFQLVLPRSLGGAQVDLPTYVRVMEELGKADASTAWCINQGGVLATFAARLQHKVAKTIWVDSPRCVLANTPAPEATAIPVEGGYRVSGRLGFSTGCRHAAWLAPYARILKPDGTAPSAQDEPDPRFLLIPVDQAELLDTWHTRGLRGTGTNHFVVDDVFVPDERTFAGRSAPLLEAGSIYVIPWTLVFGCGDAAIALGVARASLEAFGDLAAGKTAIRTVGLLREQPLVQSEVGKAEAQLRAGRALLSESVREVWQAVETTGGMTLEQGATLRIASTHGIRLAAQVVDAVYNVAGASSVYVSNPIQRRFQDIHVITQHPQARLSHYELIGRFCLGVELDPDVDLRWL